MKKILRFILGVSLIIGSGITIWAWYHTYFSLPFPTSDGQKNLFAAITALVGFFGFAQIPGVSGVLVEVFVTVGNFWSHLFPNRRAQISAAIVLILLFAAIGMNILQYQKIVIWPVSPTATPSLVNNICLTAQSQGIKNGLGVIVQGSDCIGLSDGNALFDISDDKPSYLSDALDTLKDIPIDGLPSGQVEGGWFQTSRDDVTNPEASIYYEDMQVQKGNHFHVTIVAVAALTGRNHTDGRDVLQGIYLQQKEHNDTCRSAHYERCALLSIIVANIGSGEKDQADNAKWLTERIVDAAHSDSSIRGIMSGINSQGTISIRDDIPQAVTAQLPIIAAKTTADSISGSSYLYRIVPPNSVQAQTMVDYIKNQHPSLTRIAVLYGKQDNYSSNLATDFISDFNEIGHNYQIVSEPNGVGYQLHTPKSIVSALVTALQANPDALYCACYADEVNSVLQWLVHHPQYKQLVLGGDAFYELGNYTPDVRPMLSRLRFTAFTYPDLWNILARPSDPAPPAGLNDYRQFYGAHVGNEQYGRTRMTPGVSVSYDAMLVFTSACDSVFASSGKVDAFSLEDAISHQTVIGISGRIAFEQMNILSSDPYQKIIVVVKVAAMDDQGRPGAFFQYADFCEGTFLTSSCQ